MYKALKFEWLFETFCPASTFESAGRSEARNPQRFIYVTLHTMHPFQKRQTAFQFFKCINQIYFHIGLTVFVS